MDIDAFVAAHRDDWDRLDELSKRRVLKGHEADELVRLYRRASTQLSTMQSAAPDPATLATLSNRVSRARTALAGATDPGWGDVLRFFVRGFPAEVYRARYWWIAAAVAFLVVSTATGWWVADTPAVQAASGPPDEIRQYVEHDFEDYYSANPAGSFAALVWTNNVRAAAVALLLGVLIVPSVLVLGQIAFGIGASGGIMAAHGRLDIFFGLITPHGLLELTAVFVAAGAGLRVGWAWVAPGARRRSEVLAERGRAAATIALGLVVVLLVSGVVEAFVTPSGLPTWARIGIGVAVWGAFLAYVWTYGRRAALAGETGDVAEADRGDTLPASA